ncbi:MAG: PIN domain-containing protein [archaeon]
MKLLETSYLVDYLRGRPAADGYYGEHRHESMVASTVSMFELAYGVIHEAPDDLDDLMDALHWVDFLPVSTGDAVEAARVDGELAAAGDRIPVPDLLLAGVARNRGATVVARDEHFERVAGLSVDRYRDA